MTTPRRELDWDVYLADVRSACFICDLVAGRRPHHVVWEGDDAIAFMNRYPTLRGQVLVAPKAHRERVTADFSVEECHVHWHVAPLPPGVPFAEQQAEAIRAERGILDLTDEDLATDAGAVRSHLRG